MMIYPPLDEIMQDVDSRYTLVMAAAKRAREITVDENETKIDKPVIAAINEIYQGKVTFGDKAVKKTAADAAETETTEEASE